MANYTKFSIAPDGRLVYRSTGNVVPLKNGYTVKGSTVYNRSGRKVGQLGKGTKTQQKAIEKKASIRQKRAENKAISDIVDEDIVHYYSRADWQNYLSKYKDYKDAPLEQRLKVTRQETSKQNFASALQDLVESGYVTPEDAVDLWQEYCNAPSEKEQSELWSDTIKKYGKKGWEYKQEPKGDMSKAKIE